jgi:hypothetical protein
MLRSNASSLTNRKAHGHQIVLSALIKGEDL